MRITLILSKNPFLRVSPIIFFLLIILMGQGIAQHAPELTVWQKFLKKYVDTSAADGINRVRYVSVSKPDSASIHAFLHSMQGTAVSTLTKDEQRAFWINVYNAQTVAVVLDHYPLKSIRHIKLAGSTSSGPWDSKLLKIEGKELTLNDIENNILRAQWKDKRIHFALNCASIGCPNLGVQVFTAANSEKLLESGARAFLKSRRGFDLDTNRAILNLSSIFDWYKTDFGSTEKERLNSLIPFLPVEKTELLKKFSGKIIYGYDWNLNDAAPAH